MQQLCTLLISKPKCKSQQLSCTIFCACHCSIDGNNEKNPADQWIRTLLFHSLWVFLGDKLWTWVQHFISFISNLLTFEALFMSYLSILFQTLSINDWLCTIIPPFNIASPYCKTTSLLKVTWIIFYWIAELGLIRQVLVNIVPCSCIYVCIDFIEFHA